VTRLGRTRWYTLNTQTAYKYLLFQINDRYGFSSYVKLSEIELQILPDSSTVDYSTANVVVRFQNPGAPSTGSSLTANFYSDNLTPEQQLAVQNFILDTHHFTTQFSYSSVRMVRADLNLQVCYNPSYNRNTVLNSVSSALQTLLRVTKGFISRSRKFSDLTGAVMSVKGVDYCIFFNPSNGSNIDFEIVLELTPCTVEGGSTGSALVAGFPAIPDPRSPGPEEIFLGNQSGLRADLRLSSADADDAGAAHPLFPRIRHHRSRSCDDHSVAPPICLPRRLR
jgi:hypothetical protein